MKKKVIAGILVIFLIALIPMSNPQPVRLL